MSSPSLLKLGPRTSENRSVPHPVKLHGENVLKLSRGLFHFAEVLQVV